MEIHQDRRHERKGGWGVNDVCSNFSNQPCKVGAATPVSSLQVKNQSKFVSISGDTSSLKVEVWILDTQIKTESREQLVDKSKGLYCTMRSAAMLTLLVLATLSTTLGFAPVVNCNTRLLHSSTHSRCRLSAVDESSTGSPFDSYELGQATLAYKDDAIGEGDAIEDGDVVTVSFAGRLYPSGYQFSKNDDFVFQIGEGKTMPGFDTALMGTKVGCKRTIRVPPSLAFGARGNAVSKANNVVMRRSGFSCICSRKSHRTQILSSTWR